MQIRWQKRQKLDALVKHWSWWKTVFLVTWGLWFLVLWPQWLVVDSRGIATNHLFMWGDWAAHFTYVNHFRITPIELWFAHNPIFAAAQFVYPPASSILSALLMRLGLTLKWATVLPSMVATGWLLTELWRWLRLNKLSERSTFFGVSVLLLSGAWGWSKWFNNVLAEAKLGVFDLLSFPTEFVSKDFDNFIDWVNPVVSMFLPQRAFLLGFPLLLLLFRKLQTRVQSAESHRDWSTGIDLGLLSFALFLSHAHSFLALGFLSALWFLLFPRHWRLWVSFAVSTALLVIPWYLAVMRSDIGAQVFSINLGWMAPTPLTPWGWLWFWFLNWGFFLPLWGVGAWRLWQEKQLARLRWLVPFFVVFVFGNIVQTQRWEWDNTKFFMIALVGMLPVIVEGWRWLINVAQRQLQPLRVVLLSVLILMYALQIFPGFLDLFQLSQPAMQRWEIASARDLLFAQAVEKYVPPTSIMLTGDSHNQPTSMLAGRTLFLGFKGWVWSYGLDYGGYDTAVEAMYTDVSQSAELMRTHNLRFAVVGPHEHWQFGPQLVPKRFCDLVARVDDIQLYDCLEWRETGSLSQQN